MKKHISGTTGPERKKAGATKPRNYAVGKGKPPQSGKIKKGEVRNPHGAKGKPKPTEPPKSVNDMFVSALTRTVQVQRHGKVIDMEAIQVLIDSMINNALTSGKAKDAIEVLKYMEKFGTFMDLNQRQLKFIMERDEEEKIALEALFARMDARMEALMDEYQTEDIDDQQGEGATKSFMQTRHDSNVDLDDGMI